MQPAQNQKLYSIGGASKILGISRDTLRRWDKKGKVLIGRTPGGKRFFTENDIGILSGYLKGKMPVMQNIDSPLRPVGSSPPTNKLLFLSTLIFLILSVWFFTLTPLPTELTTKAQDALNSAKDKASGLLVNLVEEGVKNKVSVGEQVLLAEIPQDLSINSLTLSDDLRVGGDTSIEGTLTVSSESNLYSLNVNNNLNVTGDSLLTGSLNVGGTINGSTLSSTALTFTGTSASIYPSSSDTSLFLNGGTTGTVNIGNSSTGDIHIGGGTQSSGCTITNNNGSLNCSSDITSSGNLRVNGGTLSTTQTTLSIDVADSGSINFRDSSNTLVSITDEGTTGNINVTGIYKIGGTTGKTIATCGSSQYLGGIAITGGIVTTLGNCNDVSSTTGTDLTLSGDLAVNGGDITSTSSTFNLLNQPTTLNIGSTNVTRAVNIGTGTNADTINIGTGTGTADTINIGGISGTTVNITGGTVNITGNLVSTGTVQGTRLISTIATGTAPLTVASTTVVPNLNASLLEGNSASTVMSQPQPNLVLNSDFGRRNKWMTFMPETFTDTSGWTAVTGSLGSVSSNILTGGTAGLWRARAGLSTWRDARFSAQTKLVADDGGEYGVMKIVDSSNYVIAYVQGGATDLFVLRKMIAGVETNVATVAYAPTLNNWYWVELEAQGTTYIAKLYSSGASPVAKASSTLVQTLSGTISDSAVTTGYIGLHNGGVTASQWGGLSTGDGGAYVEGWGPEGWVPSSTVFYDVFSDTSKWISIIGNLGTVSGNVLTSGSTGTASGGDAATWRIRAGLNTWQNVRMSSQFTVDEIANNKEWKLGKFLDTGNLVQVEWANNFLNISKVVGGTKTYVGTQNVPATITNTHKAWLEIEFQGSTVTAKAYTCASTAACIKAGATLVGTATATVSDSAVATGYISLASNITSTSKWGGIGGGEGGVYVEDYGLVFLGTKGGQAIGFDEAADSGPIGKQWAVRYYIPATDRRIQLNQDGSDGGISPSTSYTLSNYVRHAGLGGSGVMTRLSFLEQDSVQTTQATNNLDDAGETSWTRKTSSSITTNSTTRRFKMRYDLNPSSTRTGTGFFMLSQLEQGGSVTPWRNAPADDGPIVWQLQKWIPLNNSADNIDLATSIITVPVDQRDLAKNLFLPWDSSMTYEASTVGTLATTTGDIRISLIIDGSNMNTLGSSGLAAVYYNTDDIGARRTISYVYVNSLSSGKHRIGLSALATGSGGRLETAVYPTTLIITATRGKFDLAEEYSVSDQSIEAGDIVRLAPGSGSTTVEKTIGGYSQDILGIISTDPGITLGNYNSSDGSIIDGNYQSRYGQGSTLRPVALQGRVPVKVTSENGPIKRGDILTSSATLPGYAMKAIKAGRSIGVAMEPFGTDVPQDAGSSSLGSSLSPTVDSVTGLPVEEVKVGKVMTFVNLSFYDPQVYITDSGTLSVIKVGSTPVLLSSSSTGGVGGDITIDNSTTETKQSFTYQIQDRVTKEIIERIGAFNNLFVANLKVGSIDVDKIESKEIDQLKLSLTDLLTNQASLSGRIEFLENTASNSSVLGVLGSSTYTEGTPSASFNDLTIFNKLITTNLGVTGTIQSGLLSIEGINSLGNSAINTLNGDLYLQNNLLGGVNILSGKVTIDREGNVKTSSGISTAKVTIHSKDSNNASIGTATILAGETFVNISTSAVNPGSKIFVTPTIALNKSLGVTSRETGRFTVTLTSSEIFPVPFDWWVVDSN